MDKYNIPTIGLSGYTLNKSVETKITPEEKERILLFRGCPVNRKATIIMTEESFINTCLVHQKNAGLFKKNKGKRKVIITGKGFESNNWLVCSSCLIGKKVKRGIKIINPPLGIIFSTTLSTEITPYLLKKKKKKKKNIRNRKLSDIIIKNIKRMFKEKYTVNQVMDKLEIKVTKKTLYNIKNGIIWSHIKI